MAPSATLVCSIVVDTALVCVGASLIPIAHGRSHSAGVAFGSFAMVLGVFSFLILWLKHCQQCRGHRHSAYTPGDSDDLANADKSRDGSAQPVQKACFARACLPLQILLYVNIALLILVVLQLSVALATPDSTIGGFPEACPASLPIGCSRVALLNPQRDEGAVPFQTQSPSVAVAEKVAEWADGLSGELLSQEEGTAGSIFQHFRFVSFLMGFPDDVMVSTTCTESGALVEVQGQLRIGYGDIGVNVERNVALLAYLDQTHRDGKFPAGNCTSA